MSNASDFIIENGKLKRYKGSGGDVVIPEEVTEFDYTPAFLDIYEPFSLTLSGNMSADCANLLSQGIVELNIPAGTRFECSSFGPNHSPFYTKLKSINVDPDNSCCASENGILYSKDMAILYACPAAHEGNVVIPDSVTEIGPHAFDSCKQLKEIVIPASVEKIGKRAFVDCTGLKKVTIQSEKTVIDDEAFLRCSKLTSAGPIGAKKGKGYSFEFPWTTKIPENAFYGLTKLKTVVLPETIEAIGKNAFKGCKSLEVINLPENVKCDKKTFKDCKNLSI